MKLFNNIEELWNYALYCPICEQSCRQIYFNLYPDDIFLQDSFISKTDGVLLIKFVSSIKNRTNSISKIAGLLKINCITNEFSFENLKSEEDDITALLIKKILKTKCPVELFIEGQCFTCMESSVYSNDMLLDFSNNLIKNIKLNAERISIKIDDSEIYQIEQEYFDNSTTIRTSCVLDDGSFKRKATYKNNLLDIDLTDLKKSVSRIKTILVFS